MRRYAAEQAFTERKNARLSIAIGTEILSCDRRIRYLCHACKKQ